MTSDLWSGKRYGDDGRAKFGKKAMLWFRNAVRDRLTAKYKKGPDKGKRAISETDPDLEAIIDFYSDEPMRYLKWRATGSFAGGRYSVGAWELRMSMLNLDFESAVDDARRTRLRAEQAKATPTLDDWLKADISGTLLYEGAAGSGHMIEVALQNSLRYAAAMRRGRWPRNCGACGESFTPARDNARRCPTCIAERKAPLPAKCRRL